MNDTVMALTFLQHHFYVALQSIKYKGLRSEGRDGGEREREVNVKCCMKNAVIIIKMLRR